MHIGIEEAIAVIRRGEALIMVDDEDRENEGDFVCAAETITPEIVNFMARFGRGLICVPMPPERMEALNFTVSVDAVEGTSTGISAFDRAKTIRVLADPRTRAVELARPGHIFPIGAREGGVLQRSGHTEGCCDLVRLAGMQPVCVLCEILNDDGTMARMPDLEIIAETHGLKIVTIHDIIAHRIRTESLVERVAETALPNSYGKWKMLMFENSLTGETHVALVLGQPEFQESALVRVHSQCFTGDVLGSLRCECGAQLDASMQRIASEGHGVLLYMFQEGRGIGLKNKLKAYELQDRGMDTVEANEALGFRPDLRDYGIGAQILRSLGLHRLRLMTNNPRKVVGLEGYGLQVVDRVPLEVGRHSHNQRYLETKRTKLGHMFLETFSEPQDQNTSKEDDHA
jgi:3,4-dihydroxy 2-butanone 4-phosphate synthase/GTP cyclohydrolase II